MRKTKFVSFPNVKNYNEHISRHSYESTGLPENEIQKLSPIDDPANNIQITQHLTDAGEMSMEYYIGERKAREENYKLGEKRRIEHEGVPITVRCYNKIRNI